MHLLLHLLLLMRDAPEGVALAEAFAANVEVAVAEDDAAVTAAEAANVVLAGGLVLEVLALDPAVAGPAQAAVERVVVVLAIGSVPEHVKRRSRERLLAGRAHEARLVVPPR